MRHGCGLLLRMQSEAYSDAEAPAAAEDKAAGEEQHELRHPSSHWCGTGSSLLAEKQGSR